MFPFKVFLISLFSVYIFRSYCEYSGVPLLLSLVPILRHGSIVGSVVKTFKSGVVEGNKKIGKYKKTKQHITTSKHSKDERCIII